MYFNSLKKSIGIFVLLLVSAFSTPCRANTEYLLFPEGHFRYVSHNFGPYYLTGRTFDKFKIYEVSQPVERLHSTVEKLNTWTRAFKLVTGDEVIATHYSHFLSYGSFMDSLKEYDVYDDQENIIGRIEGIYETEAAAEFLFFDQNDSLFAIASLNPAYSELLITDPDGQIRFACTKTFLSTPGGGLFSIYHSEPSTEYYWTIKKMDSNPFDSRFLWPFVAFISDVWWNGQTRR